MAAGQYNVRRANLDDLPVLTGLWEIHRLDPAQQEKHMTEWQVLVRPDGVVAGAFAFRVLGQQGLLHGEAFYSAVLATEAQPAIWERVQVLARSHGLSRLWLRGPASPFWNTTGFHEADLSDLHSLPSAWNLPNAVWLTFRRHDENLLAGALGERIGEIHQAQQTEADRLRRQTLVFKWVAGLIALGFLVGALVLLVKVAWVHSRRPRP